MRYSREWCNGSIRVSKTFDLGSNPSSRACFKITNATVLFLNFQFFLVNKISTYFQDSYHELVEKVTWPTWIQLQQSTLIVLVGTAIITVMVFGMDFSSQQLLKLIYSLFK